MPHFSLFTEFPAVLAAVTYREDMTASNIFGSTATRARYATLASVASLSLLLASCAEASDETSTAEKNAGNNAATTESEAPTTSASVSPAPTEDKFYFANSDYAGIKSVVSKEETATVESYVEIPETDFPGINKIIQAEIKDLREHFRSVTRDSTPQFDGKFSERLSYTVLYRGNGVLTLALNTLFDTQGAAPERNHRVLSFDTANDAHISVADLYDGAVTADGEIIPDHPGIAELSTLAREELVANYDAAAVFPDNLTPDALGGFTLADDGHTLVLHFDAGTVGAYSTGKIAVAVDTQKLAHTPDSALATRLLGTNGDDDAKRTSSDEHAAGVEPANTANHRHLAKAPRNPDAPRVALTFDDGPAANTNRLLDTLAQYDAKASFFTVGSSIDANPAPVARALNEGHAVGNHTYNHPDLTTLGADGIRSELQRGNQAIAAATGGYTPNLLRPPYGSTNQTVNNIAAEFGLANMMWSVDTRDWEHRDSSLVCNRAVTNAYDGAVILMHDLHASTVDAVPCILDSLSSQGYEFVTADQIFGGIQPGMNYYGG